LTKLRDHTVGSDALLNGFAIIYKNRSAGGLRQLNTKQKTALAMRSNAL
jgi:hypothetical protein